MAALVVSLCLSAAAVRRHRASASTAASNSRPVAPELNVPGGPAPLTTGAIAAAAPQASPTPSPTPVVQMLKVWMYGGYFYPRTIYAKPGPTLILVRNESQANVTLVLLPYGASSSSAATVSTQNQTNSSVGGAPAIVATGVVNLSAGQYIYYDQTNPAFQGVIVVQANQ
jgi:hypothetical protein